MKKQIILTVSTLVFSTVGANAGFYGKGSFEIGKSTVQNANGIISSGYGLELGYQIPQKWFSIGIEKKDLTHNTSNKSIGVYGPPYTDVLLKEYELSSLSLNARFFLTRFEAWRPYIGGSFGKVKISEELDVSGSVFSNSSSVNHFSYMVGLETRVSENLFIDTAFIRNSNSNEAPVGSSEANGFRSMNFNFGLKYMF